MSTLYESWQEAEGDWKKSKIFLQVTKKDSSAMMGVREWMTRDQIVKLYGEEGADAIITRKQEDKRLAEQEIRAHPECPDCQSLTQYLTLNMDKQIDTEETTVSRLYEAVEGSSSSSSTSSSSQKKKKNKKGKKTKKTSEKEKKENKAANKTHIKQASVQYSAAY